MRMGIWHFWLPAVAVLFCGTVHADAKLLTFRHVTVIDGRALAPAADMDVTVEDGRIKAVTPSSSAPPHGAVIEGRGMYLMPGMMDVHVHLRGAAEAVLAGYLYEGITTVADLGNQPDYILPLRAAERAGRIASPRIFAAGNLITSPGGKSAEMGIPVTDFIKDKALLEQHVARQQPDLAKL